MEERLDRVEERLDRVEERLDRVEERLDSVESDIRELKHDVNELKANQRQMEKQICARFDYLSEAVAKVDRRLAYHTQLLNQTDKEIMRDMDALRA